MIAEIKGKISRSNSNLTERMEDELTGNVFGNLRYLSFNKGLKKILVNGVYSEENISNDISSIDFEFWDRSNIEFWPYHKEGEIDVKITFPQTVIAIEVKYFSGLSSDDGKGYDEEPDGGNFENGVAIQKGKLLSRHQLSRESRMLGDWGVGKKKILLLLADQQACHPIYKDIMNRKNIIEDDVKFGYITWQNFYNELENLQDLGLFEKVIITDLIDLLKKKGFDIYRGISTSSKIQNELIWSFEMKDIGYLFNEYFQGFTQSIEISPDLMWKFL